MAVCTYFTSGRGCRYGSSCRFEHPGQRTQYQPRPGQNPVQTQNRFSQPNPNPFDNSQRNPPNVRNDARNGPQRPRQNYAFNVDPAVIETDLTTEKPIYPFSAYAPSREAPKQLFGGQLEVSLEELRTQFYLTRYIESEPAAIQHEARLLQEANTQVQKILGDLSGAAQYVVDGQNEHPNRIDICNQGTLPDNQRGLFALGRQDTQNNSGFGPPPAPAFGQPSGNVTRGAPTSTFGRPNVGTQGPAFGAPSFPAAGSGSAFGGPSALGVKPSPFGQPAAPGASAFGTPSSLGAGAFGKPSFSQQPSPFGQQPASGATSSPFGQLGQTGDTFGKPTGANPSPFGQVPQTTTGTFGHPAGAPAPFGAPTNGTTQGIFGRPSGQTAGAFGSPINDTSMMSPTKPAFGAQPVTTSANPFGAPTAGAASTASPFARLTPPATNGVFGNPAAPSAPQPFATGSTTNAPAASVDVRSYTTRNNQGNLLTFKNYPVTYKDNKPWITIGGVKQRVWFPDGPPMAGLKAEIEPPAEVYGANIKVYEEAYRVVREQGQFKDGIMPEEPPLVEWNRYDL